MSFSRGASRLFQAVKFAVAWPIHVELEPFAVVDMKKIPAFREKDHGTGTLYRCMFDDDDIELFSRRWAVRFCDSNHTIENFGM